MDKETLKQLVKEIVKESLYIKTDVAMYADEHSTISLYFDNELICKQDLEFYID